jgi:hypothetical protein
MEKIIKALLEAKFPTLAIDQLMEVINATSNKSVATELLCGLYEMPEIPEYPAKHFADKMKNQINIKFLRFDKFTEQVHYTYNAIPFKEAWVSKTCTELPTLEDVNPKCCTWDVNSFANNMGLTKEIAENLYHKVRVFGKPSEDLEQSQVSVKIWNGETKY